VFRGCAHRCSFCPARAAGDFAGDQSVFLYDGLVERLSVELTARKEKPRIVLVGPSTDPFQPLAEIQRETLAIVRVLSRHRIITWLSTRGSIESSVLDGLADHREMIRVTVALTSLDPQIQKALEPAASPAAERLHLITELKALKIPVEVNLEPLLPNVTDSRDSLQAILESLADRDVTSVSAGYLVLRPGLREQMQRELASCPWLEPMLSAYEDAPLMRDGHQLSQFLHKSKRQRGYAMLMSLAANLGIDVRLNGLTNPDFHSPPAAASGLGTKSLRQAFRNSLQSARSAELFDA
jgi:DNA repair photolyase